DFSIMPLFVQENYLKSKFSRASSLSGPDLQLKNLELMSKAADAISDGDLVDAMIHGTQQQWSLMPFHGMMSCVRPASMCYGSGGNFPNFPAYIPTLFPRLVDPLINEGSDAIPEVMQLMDDYYLSKEDWDAIVGSALARSLSRRRYNASEHPIPYYKPEAGKAKAKKLAPAGDAPDLEEAFLGRVDRQGQAHQAEGAKKGKAKAGAAAEGKGKAAGKGKQ
ncbi:hypothetical protein JCM10207_008119, partial [Rhodosporidiobolus poonsookiae]